MIVIDYIKKKIFFKILMNIFLVKKKRKNDNVLI